MKITILKIALVSLFLLNAPLFFGQNAEKPPTEIERQKGVLKYGLESEITALIDLYIKTEDRLFIDDVFEIFKKTQNSAVREKIVQYFTVLKDRRLAEYAVAILEDPLEWRSNLVNAVFRYVTEMQIIEALPAITDIVKNETELYFYGAVTALGKLGGASEALLLSEYVDLDFPLAQKQAIVRSLGQLKAVETWPKLADIAENTDENAYMRAYAAEAIGNMKKPESVPILIKLFGDSEPLVRAAVITGLSNYTEKEAVNVILEAFKDNHYKVRLEAAAAAEKLVLTESIPVLVYRAKNDPESSVRYRCFEVLSVLGDKEAINFLITIVENTRTSDAARIKAASVLLKNQFDSGVSAVIAAARETLKDDKNKKLRYELGKEFAKYENNALADICAEYLASPDVSTRGTGLDIFAKNFFPSAAAQVRGIAENEKDANSRKAKGILELGKTDNAG